MDGRFVVFSRLVKNCREIVFGGGGVYQTLALSC